MYHLEKLEMMLNKLKENRLKCNNENYFLGLTEMEYLSF